MEEIAYVCDPRSADDYSGSFIFENGEYASELLSGYKKSNSRIQTSVPEGLYRRAEFIKAYVEACLREVENDPSVNPDRLPPITTVNNVFVIALASYVGHVEYGLYESPLYATWVETGQVSFQRVQEDGKKTSNE
jgi:hypothetical protein